MGVKGKPDIIDIIEKKNYNGMATSRGCQRSEYQNEKQNQNLAYIFGTN
jgi:hypothetical protein